MADEVDIATGAMERELELELYKIQKNMAVKEGAKFCKNCGEKMHPARRQHGFQICKECAEAIERRRALFAG
jgi:RNA polymerase-binding transcription factor DksA